jgi:hypothetical protein
MPSLQAEADLLFTLTCTRLGAVGIGKRVFERRVRNAHHEPIHEELFKSALQDIEQSDRETDDLQANLTKVPDSLITDYRSLCECKIVCTFFSVMVDEFHHSFGDKLDIMKLKRVLDDFGIQSDGEVASLLRRMNSIEEEASGGGPPDPDGTGGVEPADAGGAGAADADGAGPPDADGAGGAGPPDADGDGGAGAADADGDAAVTSHAPSGEALEIIKRIDERGWVSDRLRPRPL